MNPADILRAAAAQLMAKAAEIDGNTTPAPGFDQNDVRTWWPAMIEQAANNRAPHDYVAPGQGVLASQTGTGEAPPRSWDTHRMMWEAGQRGDPVTHGGPNIVTAGLPGWPDKSGRAFRIDDYVPHGPDAINQALVDLFFSAAAQAWLESMRSQGANLGAMGAPPTRR